MRLACVFRIKRKVNCRAGLVIPKFVTVVRSGERLCGHRQLLSRRSLRATTVLETEALVRKQDYLETREVPIGEGENNIHLYVRLKQQWDESNCLYDYQ